MVVTKAGTQFFLSPEALFQESYGRPSDIFALGTPLPPPFLTLFPLISFLTRSHQFALIIGLCFMYLLSTNDEFHNTLPEGKRPSTLAVNQPSMFSEFLKYFPNYTFFMI